MINENIPGLQLDFEYLFFPADLVTFTEKNAKWKTKFLCSCRCYQIQIVVSKYSKET